MHRDRFLVKFEGSESREDALELRGVLYIPASEARRLDSEEFWTHEIVGFEVVEKDGTRIGEVSAIVPSPAHDLLEVSTASGTALVPMVKEIVVNIDRETRTVSVDAPEGLFD